MTVKKLILVAAMLLVFFSCTPSDSDSKDTISIGVLQLIEHVALDQAYEGFVAGLAEAGYVDGENISIDYQNAQGEQANCVTIAQKFVNDDVDLILAIATPAAQAAANLTDSIPILVTAVTDPQSAMLVESNEMPGRNVSGTSDLTPVAAQMELLVDLIPSAKTVGLLYTSSEQNSIFQIDLAKKALDALGLDYIEATVSNSNEIQQVTQSLVGKVDAIYSPTDNLIAAGMATVGMVAMEAKLPVICGEEGMTMTGGLATYGINYYNLGMQTGAQAVRVLKDGADPAQMPIEYLASGELVINEDFANSIGLTIPSDL